MNVKIKVGVIVKLNDNILLIKEKVEKNNQPLWNIIKGSFGDRIETIEEAAIREAKEEAGIDIKLNSIQGVYLTQNKDSITMQPTYIGETISGIPKIASKKEQKERNENISEIRWFKKEEINKMKQDEFISPKIYQIVRDTISDTPLFPIHIIKKTK